MASGDKLKIVKSKGMSVDEGTCISSDCGDHFWYRNGKWEQLQDDGTYKDCDEPTPKDTYRFTSLKNCKLYKYEKDGKDKDGKDDEWLEAISVFDPDIDPMAKEVG